MGEFEVRSLVNAAFEREPIFQFLDGACVCVCMHLVHVYIQTDFADHHRGEVGHSSLRAAMGFAECEINKVNRKSIRMAKWF